MPSHVLTDIYPIRHVLSVADVFRILAEPSRRSILEALREGELPVKELVSRTRMSQPAVSKQLRILKDSGLVSLRVTGRDHLYSVQGRSLREASEWLSYYEHFWREGLGRMDEALQREGRTRKRP